VDKQLAWLLLVAFLIAILVAWILTRRSEKRRTEQLGAVASRLGFAFFPEPQPQLVDRLDHFHLFSQGHARKAWNLLSGNVGEVKVLLFDYRYRTGFGEYEGTHQQSALVFESDRLQLPAFSLLPQALWQGIGGVLGQTRIKWKADPKFSDRYELGGQDEDEVRAIVSEPVVAYFARHPSLWCIEGAGERLLRYHKGSLVEPGEIPGFFQDGLDILDLWIHKERALENLESAGLDLDASASL
jgi:hypothetical protein